MVNNNDHKSCVPENIVAYIYSEMASAEIPAFEKHIAECSSCAEEFAAISDARLSVFEWHRDEFAPLPTPVFEIPYPTTEKVGEPVSEVGLLVGIFGNLRWLAGVGAFAGIAAIVGLGFYFFTPNNIRDENLASKQENKTATRENKPEISKNAAVNPETAPEPVAKFKNIAPKRQAIATQVVAKSRRAPVDTTLIAANAKRRDANSKATNRNHVPTLNNFEDAEDDSLRLADLLAGVDPQNNN
jgi:hypothetical protein